MSKFTKEMVTEYADKLLIGLSEDENKMVLDEFEVIDKNIDLINFLIFHRCYFFCCYFVDDLANFLVLNEVLLNLLNLINFQ